MNRAVRCALHGSFVYTVLMNNKVWQSVGMFDPYAYIADALWLHETWQVIYMTADLKVLKCEEGFFNLLVGDGTAHLYITNSVRLLSQEISASYGHETWQDIENAMHSGTFTVTVGDEDFTLDIVQSRIPLTYFGLASNKRDDPITTAVSGSAKQVRSMLVRKLRKHVQLAAY